MTESNSTTRCGFVALVGRPNVGKSTLLNAIIGEKVSITSKKPQTTRQRIRGIKTQGHIQAIYVDTPGLHRASRHELNRSMNQAALHALSDVDVIVFVVEALTWRDEDQFVLDKLLGRQQPVIVAVNKIDMLENKNSLLPFIETISQRHSFSDIVPIAAETRQNIAALEQTIAKYLPEGLHHFAAEQHTDSPAIFQYAEIIREKLTRFLGQELPYAVTVEVVESVKKETIQHIHAIIWVAKETQKAIVVGEHGAKVKQIGQAARRDMEKLLKQQVYLNLWVKVKENWYDNPQWLNQFGYID